MTPADLGLPPKFQSWQPGQWDIITHIVTSDTDLAIAAPTGVGKSVQYIAAGLLSGGRVRVLTETKALQDQLVRDFGSLVALVKGKSNYECPFHGHCEAGGEEGCPNMESDACPHTEAINTASRAQIVIANYAWHCATQVYGQSKVGQPDMLILDEGHSAMKAVSDALTVELTENDFTRLGLSPPTGEGQFGPAGEYGDWAKAALERVKTRLLALTGKIPAPINQEDAQPAQAPVFAEERANRATNRGNKTEIIALRRLRRKLGILQMATGDWVYRVIPVPGTEYHHWVVTPLWPRAAARRLLNAPRVVVMSATLTRKSMELIGWKDGEYEFLELDSPFDPDRSPILFLPTTFMSYKASLDQIRIWRNAHNRIALSRMDRKGITHPISFDRGRLIQDGLPPELAKITHTPGRGAGAAGINRFLKANPPALLISPSVTTGYDFPGDQCRYQILAKIPYPDRSDYMVKRRAESDPVWYAHETIQTVIQITGRGTRGPGDWCENWIIDNMISKLMDSHRHRFPQWWLRRYKRAVSVQPIGNNPLLVELAGGRQLIPPPTQSSYRYPPPLTRPPLQPDPDFPFSEDDIPF